MNNVIEAITSINNAINGAVWGLPDLILLIGTGIIVTVGTKFFQVSHIGHCFKNTIFSIFNKDHRSADNKDKKAISQFQAFCAATKTQTASGRAALFFHTIKTSRTKPEARAKIELKSNNFTINKGDILWILPLSL